jgi:pimeloyl-ACP methyl ester carboxylesterase
MLMVEWTRDRSLTSGATATLALIPSLGTAARVWDKAATALSGLAPDVQILRMDLPGHGCAPPHVGFELEELADAAIAGLEQSGCAAAVVIAGISMGGAIALEVARRAPSWLAGFAMFNSAARFGDSQGWAKLADQVQSQGTASLRTSSAEGWFSPAFRNGSYVQQLISDLADVDDASYLACCAALAQYRGDHGLDRIHVPALLVGATDDDATPPWPLRWLSGQLPRAEYAELSRGRHLAPAEHPVDVAELLTTFVTRTTGRSGGNQ